MAETAARRDDNDEGPLTEALTNLATTLRRLSGAACIAKPLSAVDVL